MIIIGIHNMKNRVTKFPKLLIIFRVVKSTEKNFLHASSFNKCSNSQLEGVLSVIDRSNYTNEEVNDVVRERFNWESSLRKL